MREAARDTGVSLRVILRQSDHQLWNPSPRLLVQSNPRTRRRRRQSRLPVLSSCQYSYPVASTALRIGPSCSSSHPPTRAPPTTNRARARDGSHPQEGAAHGCSASFPWAFKAPDRPTTLRLASCSRLLLLAELPALHYSNCMTGSSPPPTAVSLSLFIRSSMLRPSFFDLTPTHMFRRQ